MRGMRRKSRIARRFEEEEEGLHKGWLKAIALSAARYRAGLWWWAGVTTGLSFIFLLPFKGESFPRGTGLVVLTALFVFFLFVYILRFEPDFLVPRRLHLMAILLISVSLMGRIIILLPQVSNYFIPLGFLSILASLLLLPSLSVIMSLLLAILFSLSANSLEIMPILAFGGVIGAYSASFIHQRVDITRTGIHIGLSNVLMTLGVGLLLDRSSFEIASLGLWGMGNGLFSSILAMGVLPYLETYFGVTTDIKLLELANLDLPLLKRLSIEAPGTYHHSIMVANLAEAGANAVGVNPLLARVGSYYHDIGKIRRPHFFFENSGMLKGNSHERMTPNLSSTIIISHVKDGVELARRNRLPQVIIDIIEQHHGTGLIAYFYREALLKAKNTPKERSIEEESFRYPGPKPQSKEAAIVMLADSVEAAFRFSPQRTVKGIALQVKTVIDNKLKDNQLDECQLTLKETRKIAEAFTRVLRGVSHVRGRYPDEMLKKAEKRIGDV